MTENVERSRLPLIRRSRLVKDLRALGIRAGDTVMPHVSVKAIGWIVGGPEVVLDALCEVVGEQATIVMGVGWEDDLYTMEGWNQEKKQAYIEEGPAFDPETSRACREWGILCEYIRTRRGAHRSANPGHPFAAVGAKADWITRDHGYKDGLGPSGPLGRLVEANGKIAMLGAPLSSITLLHLSEYMADLPKKRRVKYAAPVMQNGMRVWVEVDELNSGSGIVHWDGEDYFALIGRAFLAEGHGHSGDVGAAESYLFDARELVEFGAAWMERNLRSSG